MPETPSLPTPCSDLATSAAVGAAVAIVLVAPPTGNDAKCEAGHTIAAAKDYVFTAYPKR